MSATFIAHFMGKNISIFENVTKQAFIFEHYRLVMSKLDCYRPLGDRDGLLHLNSTSNNYSHT